MNTVTIILAYYENAGMLDEQCAYLAALPEDMRAHLRLIVVDDGSPNAPARGSDIGLPFEIYRTLVDVRWNQDFARNLGVHHAPPGWMLLTDMDHRPPRETLRALIEGDYDERAAYKFKRVSMPRLDPYKPHPNSWFLTKALYDKAGGFDERFAGYYGTDWDFRDRLQKAAREITMLDEILIRYPREVIPDASTTTYARREKWDGPNIAKIKEARAREKGWQPKRLSFPWEKVWPSP